MNPTLYHRHGLGQFLVDLGLVGHGVEVGSAFGGFAQRIVEQWPGECLHLVDPWVKQDPNVYREKTNHEAPFQSWYENAKSILSPYGNRVQFHRMFSSEGSALFADGSLDFVYLDGNHSFEAVSEDLRLWVPKIKPGGLVSGHDYGNGITDGHYCQVKDALDKWAAENSVSFRLTAGGCSSWYFIK